MRRHWLLWEPGALAKVKCAHQCRNSGTDVHHSPAGEIQSWKFSAQGRIQQPTLPPHHVRQRRIHDQKPEHQKQHRAAELHALRGRSGNQRRGNNREHQLIDHEGHLWNRSGIIGIRLHAYAAQKRMLKSANYRPVAAKAQAVAH